MPSWVEILYNFGKVVETYRTHVGRDHLAAIHIHCWDIYHMPVEKVPVPSIPRARFCIT